MITKTNTNLSSLYSVFARYSLDFSFLSSSRSGLFTSGCGSLMATAISSGPKSCLPLTHHQSSITGPYTFFLESWMATTLEHLDLRPGPGPNHGLASPPLITNRSLALLLNERDFPSPMNVNTDLSLLYPISAGFHII